MGQWGRARRWAVRADFPAAGWVRSVLKAGARHVRRGGGMNWAAARDMAVFTWVGGQGRRTSALHVLF